jgi:hypothetical protein
MLDHAYVGVRDAKALLAAVQDCGVTPPQLLTDLLTGYDELNSADTGTNALDQLVKVFSTGQAMTPDQRDKVIADAWAAQGIAEFRAGLQQRVEPALLRQFGQALENGAADQVISALAQAFNENARALEKCAQLVDPNVNPEVFIAQADAESLQAWRAIDVHVAALAKISAVVGQFGPMSTTWKLVDRPANIPGAEFLDNNGVLCVAPEYDLVQACKAFRLVHGGHRNSAWFKLAPVLKLCTIAEAREKVRAWSEIGWDGLGLNQGRGRMDPEHGFIPEPISNPYSPKDAAKV